MLLLAGGRSNVCDVRFRRKDRVLDLNRAPRCRHGRDDQRRDMVHRDGDTTRRSGRPTTPEQCSAAAPCRAAAP